MNKLLHATILTAVLSAPAFVSARSETDIQAMSSGFWHMEELYLDNITYGSANPAHIGNIPTEQINDIQIHYDMQNGSFKPVDGALHKRLSGADIYGVRKLERVFFEGRINYVNSALDDMRWNGTALTSSLNPFIIADTLRYDSLTNDVDREQFKLNGSVAYNLNGKITLGLSAIYNVVCKADQSDPRVLDRASRTTLLPGIAFRIGHSYSAGLSGKVELYHENVSSSVEDNMIGVHNNIYIFKSLGGYEGKDALGYQRRYEGMKYGASLQSVFEGERLGNFTRIDFEMNSENAVDGGESYKYKGGDFKQTDLGVTSRFVISKERLVHNVTLSAGLETGKGTWYTQKQVQDEWKVNAYQVVSKNMVHKQNNLNAGLSYRLDVIHNGSSRFSADIDASYGSVNISQYPDDNYAKYSILNTGCVLTGRFGERKYKFEAKVFGEMDKAIEKLDISVQTLKGADKRFYYGYFLPKYSYMAADSFCAGLGGTVFRSISVDGKHTVVRLSVQAYLREYQGDYDKLTGTDRTGTMFSLGYTF